MQFLSEKLLISWIRWGTYALPITLFLYIQKTLFPFVTLKVTIFQIVAVLIFALWLLLVVQHPQYRPRKSRMVIAVGAFVVVLIISSLTALNVNRAFFSSPDRAIGVLALLHFAVLTIVLAAAKPIVDWRRYVNYLFWVSVGMSAFAILQRFAPTLFFVTDGSRPGGTLGNPQYLTGYLITNFFIGLWLLSRPLQNFAVRNRYLAGLAVILVAFILANTRGAVLGLVTGLLVVLIYQAYKKLRPFELKASIYKNSALWALAGIMILGGIFLFTKQSSFWQRVPVFDRLAQTSLADITTNNRLIVWKISLDAIKERPLLGWGWDNFRYPFNTRFDPALFATGSSESYWDKPHNILLEIGASTGLIGLAAYLYLIYLLVRRLSKSEKFGVYGAAMVLGYFAQNMVSFDTFGSLLMLFVLLGIAAFDPMEKSAALNSPVNTRTLAKFSGAAVIAVLAVAASSAVTVQIFRANRANYNAMNYLAQIQNDPEFLAIGLDYFQEALAIRQPYSNEVRESYLATLKQLLTQGEFPGVVQVAEDAINQMEKATATDPKNFYFYQSLAEAKNIFARFDKSLLDGVEEDLQKADALSPRRQQIYYARSRAKLLMGDMDGAVEVMRQAVELAPDAAEPHFYYALLLMDVEDYEEGVKQLFEAGKLGRWPKNGGEARAVNTYLERSKRFIDEINYFDQALDNAQLTDETQFEFLLQLGKGYYGAISYANARMVFEDVLKLAPRFRENPRFADEFAKIFSDVGL